MSRKRFAKVVYVSDIMHDRRISRMTIYDGSAKRNVKQLGTSVYTK